MNEDEMRDALAAALWRLDVPPEPPIPWPEKWADALLPVVRRIAAEELRAAMYLMADRHDHAQLKARADTLDPPPAA